MEGKPNTKRIIFIVIAAIVVIVLLALLITNLNRSSVEKLSYDELLEQIESGNVSGIYFTDSYTVNVLYKSETDERNIANVCKRHLYNHLPRRFGKSDRTVQYILFGGGVTDYLAERTAKQ